MFYSLERNLPEDAIRVDFATENGQVFPQGVLYFCNECQKLISRHDIAEVLDSYYCSQCLEGTPAATAITQSVRCRQCCVCPRCASNLVLVARTCNAADPAGEVEEMFNFAAAAAADERKGAGGTKKTEKIHFLLCYFCNWSSLHLDGYNATSVEKLLSFLQKAESRTPTALYLKDVVASLRLRLSDATSQVGATQLKRGLWPSGQYPSQNLSSALSINSGQRQLDAKEDELRHQDVWAALPSTLQGYLQKGGQDNRPLKLSASELLELDQSGEGPDGSSAAEVFARDMTYIDREVVDDLPSMDRFLAYPHMRLTSSREMVPLLRPLLANRSHRCRTCKRLVYHSQLKRTSRPRLDLSAVTVMPRITLIRVTTDTDGQLKRLDMDSRFPRLQASTAVFECEITNIQDSTLTIAFKFAELPATLANEMTAEISTGDFETSIGAYDIVAEGDGPGDAAANVSGGGETSVILSRKGHKLRIGFPFRLKPETKEGDILRIGFTCLLTSHKHKSLAWRPVFTLGRLGALQDMTARN